MDSTKALNAKLEAAARAICLAEGPDPDGEIYDAENGKIVSPAWRYYQAHADAVLAALAEQGEAPQPISDTCLDGRAWQPIESAPKDGTAILAANARHPSHAPVAVCWKEEPEDSDVGPEPHWADAATHGGDALYFNGRYFTHWMPLPARPKAGSAQ